MNPSAPIVAHPQPKVKDSLLHGYDSGTMPESSKRAAKDRIHNRIRAHIRAAMVANALNLTETADLLREDKGALSAYLNDRAPNAYLVARILEVFDFADPMDLFTKDPPAEFFRPGPPVIPEKPYSMKRRVEHPGDEGSPPAPRRRPSSRPHG